MDPRLMAFLLLGSMLFFGSYNTINTKLQYQMCVPTLYPEAARSDPNNRCGPGEKTFDKPWLVNMYMFLGEATLLFVYGMKRRKISVASGQAALSSHEADAVAETRVPFYMFAIPAACDVFGTGLAAVGQTYLDSAIWQMLRSSIIIFSAILAKLLLGKSLDPFKWVAVLIVFVGLIIVGLASSLDAKASSTGRGAGGQLVGCALTVGAQICSAFQMTFEEKILKVRPGQKKVSAKKVVGAEGIWGGFFMCVILGIMTVPGTGQDGNPDVKGSFESLPDGLHMLAHSWELIFLALTYTASIAIYNLSGIVVGKKFTTVVRCLIDSSRTVTVWGVSLLLYYGVSEEYGSGITSHTWLQLIGFFILILGTVVYNDLAPSIIPNCLRSELHEEESGFVSNASFDGILANLALTEEEDEDILYQARDVGRGTSLVNGADA
ncbi:unnamed protein product [Prorocentrum cordatum]|uniref:EamA domain-containing protein n=1 Tax=Prorocentrum cordatum TaxID=2364126 RepID=A0ABN9T3F2_9DINO|nr:unnamed protein product [Polarella glacialis]